MHLTTYHRLVRVSVLVLTAVTLFQSGFLNSKTGEWFAISLHQLSLSVAGSQAASIPVSVNETHSFILISLLFVSLVLVVLNYSFVHLGRK